MRAFSLHKRSLVEDSSGLATIEFAIASTVLMLGLLNGLELGRYSFQKMELANAVHSAAQAAWNACDTKHLPAKTNCSGPLTAAITSGLQSTSLGSSVTLSASSPSEGYYCITSAGALKKEADYTATKPTDCSAESDSAHTPGDYLVITATYTYAPIFGRSLTVGAFMPTTLTSTSTIRLQ